MGIKSEGVSEYLSDELLNKSSMKKLIEISKDVINYVKIFLVCLRYRKKIMKIFLEAMKEINKYEIEYNSEFDENKKALINELDSLKNISYYNQKNWRSALSKEKISLFSTDINALIPIINNYIEFARNEHKAFSKNWEKFQDNINERHNLSIDYLKELNEAKANNININQKQYKERYQKKSRKLKEAIKNGVDFIQKTVPTTREKDKNEMLKLESAFEKVLNNCQNINNEIISNTEDDINNSANTDIFEECKAVIIKYFYRFKIQNYDTFLETMKIKLLVNTKLNEEKLGQGVYQKLSNEMVEEEKISQSNFICEDSQFEGQFELYNNRQRSQTISAIKSDKYKNKFLPKTKINNFNPNISNINNNNIRNTLFSNNNNNNLRNNFKNSKQNLSKSIINDNNIISSCLNNNIAKSKNSNNNINNNTTKKCLSSRINSNINNKLLKNIDNNNNNENINIITNNIQNDINNNLKSSNLDNNINNDLNKIFDSNLNATPNNIMIEEENNINNIEENEDEYNISSYQILNELEKEDNLELMDENKLTRYTEMKDPFSNFKEEELNNLINKKEEEGGIRELGEGENKIKAFSCALSSQIISRGTLMVTNKKIEFNSSFFQKIQIIIPLSDITSIKKRKTSLGMDNSIEIKTEKVSYLFTSFLKRDLCYLILDNEIKRIKNELKESKNNNEEEKVDANSPEQKYLGKKRFKAKQVSKMLEEIEFYKKLEEITKERMELFTKEYTDEKKGFFVSQKTLTRKYAEETFNDCPLFVIFTTLCKMTTQLEEYKSKKGFFESLFLERNDTEVQFTENQEFTNVPNYFDNGDYIMNLFSQFNKEDFENFLNEIQNWPHKYEYSCHAIHKVKKVPMGPSQVVMKDKFIAYFISPTLLIFDDMAFATEFTFCDTFVPLFRYRFDCDIKFNDKKAKFEFNTKMTISYITIFLSSIWLRNAIESKSNDDTEQLIKGEILDKLKDSINIYRERFQDIFERGTDETFQRKIDLKQNMITGEYEENIIEGVGEEENLEEEENKEKKEEKENNENNENNSNNENGGMIKSINEFIDNNKTYIFIGIVSVIIIGIILSLFNSSKGKGALTIDTIFNLIILGAIFYLFKFKN